MHPSTTHDQQARLHPMPTRMQATTRNNRTRPSLLQPVGHNSRLQENAMKLNQQHHTGQPANRHHHIRPTANVKRTEPTSEPK
mmetsp:Transcript_909/g.1492  ORF Transcript_909/g.1492 Transcript_909/m.1492 type:complete len:83 (-) Transcript_909:181-429(-)